MIERTHRPHPSPALHRSRVQHDAKVASIRRDLAHATPPRLTAAAAAVVRRAGYCPLIMLAIATRRRSPICAYFTARRLLVQSRPEHEQCSKGMKMVVSCLVATEESGYVREITTLFRGDILLSSKCSTDIFNRRLLYLPGTRRDAIACEPLAMALDRQRPSCSAHGPEQLGCWRHVPICDMWPAAATTFDWTRARGAAPASGSDGGRDEIGVNEAISGRRLPKKSPNNPSP